MYRQYFGLTKDPFTMTPDPSVLFLTSAHREALAGLSYAILSRKGFVVLTGDAGTGKTTILMRLLQSIPSSRARFSVILNSTLTPAEFLELALLDFGLSDIPASKAQRLVMLRQFLISAHDQNKAVVLVVDEAHKLSADVLEEIRLLTNFETPEGKLLQIVLAGQEELRDTLNRQDLRQLKQRIAVRVAIQALAYPQVEEYIRYRWMKAGGQQHPFAPEAIEWIAQRSNGIPRLVNAVCDNSLTLAFAQGLHSIGAQQVAEVVKDLDLADGYYKIGSGQKLGATGNGTARQRSSQAPGQRLVAAAPTPNPIPILERYSPTTGKRKTGLWAKLGFHRRTLKDEQTV